LGATEFAFTGTQRRARKRNNSETTLIGNLLLKTSTLVPRISRETQIIVAETERKKSKLPGKPDSVAAAHRRNTNLCYVISIIE
jgi:hypothetical protein